MKTASFGWIIRLAWREIRANRKFSFFFCMNLVLGLVGLLALDAFKDSLQSSMSSKSKFLLGADISISARRPISDAELAAARSVLGPNVQETQTLELYSMLQGKKATRLAELRAIENAYPYYGKLTLEDGKVSEGGDLRDLESSRSIWLSPELALQLGLVVGDEVGVGSVKYRVSGIVADDTASSWRGFSLASPAWVGFSRIGDSGLVRAGSNISYRHLYQLAPGQDVDEINDRLSEKIPDPTVRITTHERASDQVSRTIDYVNDYLGLVSLVALFFAALGAAYLFRSFLTKKLSEIAILITLGVPNTRASRVFWVQLSILGLIAACVATGIAALLLPGMSAFLREYLAIPIAAKLGLSTVLLSFFLGSVGSVLICLPLLTKVENLKPAQLFSEEAQPQVGFDRKKIVPSLLLVFVFWTLSCWQAKSWFVGSLFVIAFGLAGAGLAAIGLFYLSLLSRLKVQGLPFRTKLAIRNLSRAKLSSLSCFLALGLGALLLNLIPQIQGNIQSEIEAPTRNRLPSLFLFDIQDEQVKDLVSWLKTEKQIELEHLSPMIRARLQSVNGKAFERDDVEYAQATREEQRSAQSRNRMFNLNFRDRLGDAEKIVKGREFRGSYDPASGKLPELTLEYRFADRLGLKLGDRIDFDIEGVEVSGEVVGTRSVNWMSFQPNFFVTFQPGVLEEAPKIWLASITSLPLERKIELQNQMVERYTNISIVDVEKTVSKILEVFSQIGLAVRLMAILTLTAGFAVLFSIANHQASTRKRETSLMKVLGAKFEDVESIFVREMFWVAASAAALGSLLSLIFSFVLVDRVFDMPWQPNIWIPMGTVVAVAVVSALLSKLAARRALLVKPLALLQDTRD